MKNRKTAFVVSVSLFFLLYALSKFGQGTAIYDFRSNYGGSLIDPLEYSSVALVLTTAILLFFSEKIFNLWLKKFMVWFVPLAIFLTATGSVEVSYGWPTRTSFAILTGEIMVAVTLLFALVQRFYYKK